MKKIILSALLASTVAATAFAQSEAAAGSNVFKLIADGTLTQVTIAGPTLSKANELKVLKKVASSDYTVTQDSTNKDLYTVTVGGKTNPVNVSCTKQAAVAAVAATATTPAASAMPASLLCKLAS